MRALLPQEVIPAAVYVGTEMAGPGMSASWGATGHERSKASRGVAARDDRAGVPIDISATLRGALWAKLNHGIARTTALSAITQLPYGPALKGRALTVSCATSSMSAWPCESRWRDAPGESMRCPQLPRRRRPYSSTRRIWRAASV